MKKFLIFATLFVAIIALCGWNEEPVSCLVSKCVFCIFLMLSAGLARRWDGELRHYLDED